MKKPRKLKFGRKFQILKNCKKVRICTLIENEKDGEKESLVNEFGFSLYIEDGDFKFIFDTGQTGEFVENAFKMGVDLKEVQDIVLSHSHYDHTGGVKTFVERVSPKFNLHVNESFFDEKYKVLEDGSLKFLGNNFTKEFLCEKGVNIIPLSEDTVKLSENVRLHTNFLPLNDFEKLQDCYVRKIGEEYPVDNMQDEVCLAIDTSKGLFVVVGCSHVGIANILENVKRREKKEISGILGGLHLKNVSDEILDKIIDYFVENDIKYFGTCHCTGDRFLQKIQNMEGLNGKKFVLISTGWDCEI